MKVEIWDSHEEVFKPRQMIFGSNIRGLRIKKDSVVIQPNEVLRFMYFHSEEALVEYLQIMETCYKRN